MQIYRIEYGPAGELDSFAATRTEAHDFGKLQQPRSTVRIELHEFDMTKANIVAVFKNDDIDSKVIQTWSLTDRGGLQECTNGQ